MFTATNEGIPFLPKLYELRTDDEETVKENGILIPEKKGCWAGKTTSNLYKFL